MQVLLLRLDAPLMSFGGVMVDQHGPIERFPGLSMLTGLCGNALGYKHEHAAALESLQARIHYAARWDVEPEELRDYQTVDLGQPKMAEHGWTTRGEPEHRTGGPSAIQGIHQRFRHYWANGVMTVALILTGTCTPDIFTLAAAFQFPARPLFLGRKTCLPAAPLFLKIVEAHSPLSALRQLPSASRSGHVSIKRMAACWHEAITDGESEHGQPIYDHRDWYNQVHAGRRIRFEGWVEVDP